MKKTIIVLIMLISFLSFLSFANAQTTKTSTGTTAETSTKTLPNPINITNPNDLIKRVIEGVLGVVGAFALLMFVYGGFMWMLSGGNEQMIEKGKNTLMWAALGLVIIFMSYTLVKFIIDTAT